MTDYIVLASAAIIFSLRIAYFMYGIKKEKDKGLPKIKPGEEPFVSVVVPARNEENNIRSCVESIFKSNYPQDKFELIVINDRSTDSTGKILNELKFLYPSLNVITVVNPRTEINLKGKPGALQAGIEQAKGEVILMTDADCKVPPNWIATFSRAYAGTDTALASSYTITSCSNAFERLQTIEWIYMNALGTGAIGWKKPMGCYGNNMSVRKKDFDALGGYRGVEFTVTEDLALQLKMNKLGLEERYICHPDTLIYTEPVESLQEYIRQHQRWAKGGRKMGWRAFWFVITSMSLWAGIAYSIATGNYLLLASLVAMRIAGDMIFLAPIMKKLGIPELIKHIPLSVTFLLLLELGAPLLLLKRNIIWKGQVMQNAKPAQT